jgi:SAM-dependent methyltransferase
LVSEPYRADNLLDRVGDAETRQLHYDQEMRRERAILERRLPLAGGDVLSVGCGRHPGRHLFPKPAFRMTGVDLDDELIASLRELGELDDGMVGRAGELPYEPDSFDVVLYRLVLHHVAYQGPVEPAFAEAARLLRPGGRLIFLVNGTLLMLCAPDDENEPATDRLLRDYFGMHRFEWPGEEGVNFYLGYGDWIRLLRREGFEVLDLIEIQAPEGAKDNVHGLAGPEWARQWPVEEIWRARKRG